MVTFVLSFLFAYLHDCFLALCSVLRCFVLFFACLLMCLSACLSFWLRVCLFARARLRICDGNGLERLTVVYVRLHAPFCLFMIDALRTCCCHRCTETVPVINACVGMIRSWMRVMNSVVAIAELVSVIRPIPRSELPWLPSVIFYSLFSAYLALCHAARRARNLYYTQLRSISASLTTVGITWPSPLREYGRPPQL